MAIPCDRWTNTCRSCTSTTRFPDAYRDLVEGRAIAVGPDDADLGTADAVLAGAKRAWNAEAFALGPNMKVISRIGIGYDNVDVAAATAAGVIVCNAPDAPSVSTAEHTLMLMLAVVKNLPAQTDRARQGLAGRHHWHCVGARRHGVGLGGLRPHRPPRRCCGHGRWA